jgi:alanyl aminopeptidase
MSSRSTLPSPPRPSRLAALLHGTCLLLLPSLTPAQPPAKPAPPASPAPTLRLPAGARPTGYQIHLRLLPGADQFSGTVEIALAVTAPLPVLWLNAAPEVVIDRAEFVPAKPGGARLFVPGQERAGRDFVALRPSATLQPGEWRLRMDYHAKLLKNEGVGLFTERDGGDDYIFSDLEAIDARRAFPCFDEPEYKVPLRLSVDVPAAHLATANAPVESETPLADNPGHKRVVFRATPPLPTYLWALAVGPFGVVPAGKGGSRGVPLRILTLRGREAEGRYAAQVTAPLLDLLERYTGVPFPYDKLDQIAVPNQSHAMENPGLITYGLRLLQMRPEEETVGARRRFAQVCAHELAHHWTGDLVTLKFWDDLWLNESFASFLDSKITEQFQPGWEEPLERVGSRAGAMDSDSLHSARRIRQPITSNDDIVNAFDPITYAKGKAVLGMLEDWLTPPVFQRGLTRYLRTHAHGTAVAADFLSALRTEAEAAGKRAEALALPGVAASFLDQPGVPLVSLRLQCQAGSARLAYTQERYFPLAAAGAAKDPGAALRYRVPLCFSVDGGEPRCELLESDRGEIALGETCPRTLLPDPKSSGYYRLRYEGTLFDDLLRRAFPGQPTSREIALAPPLPPLARLGFLRNIEAGLRRGDVALSQVLPLLPALASDPSRHVVSLGLGTAATLRDYVSEGKRPAYASQVVAPFAERLRRLGLRTGAGDDDNTRILRAQLLSLSLGDAEKSPATAALQTQAEALLSTWLSDRNALDAETAHALALSTPQRAGEPLWQAMLATTRRETDRGRRGLLFTALGQFRDPVLAEKSLALLLSPDFAIRETLPILYRLASFPETRGLTYAFVQKNFDALVARLPRDGGAGLSRVIAGFCDADLAASAEQFFTGRSTQYTGGPRILRQSTERARQCAALRAVYGPQLDTALRAPATAPPRR